MLVICRHIECARHFAVCDHRKSLPTPTELLSTGRATTAEPQLALVPCIETF